MGVPVLVDVQLEEDLGHVGLDRAVGDVQALAVREPSQRSRSCDSYP